MSPLPLSHLHDRSEGFSGLLKFAGVFAVMVSAMSAFSAEPQKAAVLPLDGSEQVRETFTTKDVERFLKHSSEDGDTVDGNGALHFGGTAPTRDGSKYFGVMISLPKPVDLTGRRILFHARTNHPDNTAAFYVRAYNRGESKPAWSFNSWNGQLGKTWREFDIQEGLSLSGLAWEKGTVDDRVATAIDRFEFIIGTRENDVPVDVLLDNFCLGEKLTTLEDLETAHHSDPNTVLVDNGQAIVTILHPDSEPGRRAAATVAASIADRTGATPSVRAGTEDDRIPDGPTILLGNVDNNPAMLLLYARYMTPADSVCPGIGGALVHTVCDPFGRGANVIVAAASDNAGLVKAAEVLAGKIAKQKKGRSLTLPRLFEKHYGESFLKRFGWADDEPAANRLESGLKQGQEALDKGRHTSVAGILASVANRYRLTGHSVEAETVRQALGSLRRKRRGRSPQVWRTLGIRQRFPVGPGRHGLGSHRGRSRAER